MHKGRLEAFSDGVIAIVITIMVLELHPPAEPTLTALRPLVPSLLAYLLSFVNLAIYWANHHHMFQLVRRVSGAVLWANIHLLFWLSLIPVTTAWIGEDPHASIPTAIYGAVLLMASLAYYLLSRTIIATEGPDSPLARAVGADRKGRVSTALYVAAVGLALVRPWLAQALITIVALIWLVPDRRIESRIDRHAGGAAATE